ncbi:MAG: capsule assembly Wzi family protein [Acidobacteriaceae bacterium]
MRAFLRIFVAAAVCAVLPVAHAASARSIPGPQSSDLPSPYLTNTEGSTYVPMDSWIYPALDRLHAMGYLDTAFMGIRPWTRLQIAWILEQDAAKIQFNANKDPQAYEIYYAVWNNIEPTLAHPTTLFHPRTVLGSVYTSVRGISGTPLRDSYHLGQTIINDYGRPYAEGFNNYTGFSTRTRAGRFSLYFRGEFQHAPSTTGYSQNLAQYLAEQIDYVPYNPNIRYDWLPAGQIPASNYFRIMEANLSFHLLGNEISLGKTDHWLGPDKGTVMSWSNNAENIYSFQINDIQPFRIPILSLLTGPFRYEFFVGSLKGHTYPNEPWVHMEKLSFKPTRNLEMGFDRTIIWGGLGHEPVTLHTFLKSFFSFQNVPASEKNSVNDPGARFSSFDFNYRLPFLRNWVTIYADSLVHDDVSPVDTPRRSSIAPGIYLSHFPGLPKLSMRVEAVSTDPVSNHDQRGQFMEYETIQRQGTTNKGNTFGSWIGRENKGGQAWLTWHFSPKEEAQFIYRRDKASSAFIPRSTDLSFQNGGTTQNDFTFSLTRRLLPAKNLEVHVWVQYENYLIPLLNPQTQSDTTADFRLTWYPRKNKIF